VVTVHEFDARIFNELVQRQNLELFEQRSRVGSERGITNYAFGLFLKIEIEILNLLSTVESMEW
jgi:hypothetical protein